MGSGTKPIDPTWVGQSVMKPVAMRGKSTDETLKVFMTFSKKALCQNFTIETLMVYRALGLHAFGAACRY